MGFMIAIYLQKTQTLDYKLFGVFPK
jgi:hypothetical protein